MKTLNPDNPIRDGLKRLLSTLLAPASIAILASTPAQAASLSGESFSGYIPGTLLSACGKTIYHPRSIIQNSKFKIGTPASHPLSGV